MKYQNVLKVMYCNISSVHDLTLHPKGEPPIAFDVELDHMGVVIPLHSTISSSNSISRMYNYDKTILFGTNFTSISKSS